MPVFSSPALSSLLGAGFNPVISFLEISSQVHSILPSSHLFNFLVAGVCRWSHRREVRGEYLALTGQKLNGVEMIASGLSTHYCLDSLTLLGYNHKLRILLETVNEKIANFEVKHDRFSVIKETVTKEYQNYKFRQPYHQAMYYCSLILQGQTLPWTEELDVLSHLEAEDVAKFVPMLLSRTFIECYIAGNVENNCRPLFPSQHLTNRVVKLKEGMK